MRRVTDHSINRKPDKSWAPPVVFLVCNGMTTSPIINMFPIHISQYIYYSATVTARWCSLNDDDGEEEDGLWRITEKYSEYLTHTGGRQAAMSPPHPPFSSPNNYSGYQTKNNEMGGACSQQEGDKRVFVGRSEGTRPLGRPRRRWKDNIKMNLQEVGWGRGLDWSGSGKGQMVGPCECGIEPSSSIKYVQFLS
jgi:hypothetical protein